MCHESDTDRIDHHLSRPSPGRTPSEPARSPQVAAAETPEEWRESLEAWAADVWAGWPDPARQAVRELTHGLLPEQYGRG
jgi:hypothetical protein